MKPDELRQFQARAMSEAELQALVWALAEVTGWRLRYHTYDSRRSQAGFPDLCMVRGHRVLFAELKRQTGRVTVDQQAWADGLVAAGVVEYYLWRPMDWLDGSIGAALAR